MDLRLRDPIAADLDLVFAWESDPRAVGLAAFTRPDPSDRAAFDEHYRRVRADPANRLRAIEQDGDLVGTIGSYASNGEREVTYWIASDRWGRGIATAALRLFLAEELHRPLFGRVAETNPGSGAVLAKAGFERIGQEVAYATGLGREVTEFVYRLR